MQMLLTASTSTTDSSIARIVGIATNISYSCIVKALSTKLVAVAVLDAPKAASCQGTLCSAFRNVLGGRVGIEAHWCGRRGEGAHKALKDGGHRRVCVWG